MKILSSFILILFNLISLSFNYSKTNISDINIKEVYKTNDNKIKVPFYLHPVIYNDKLIVKADYIIGENRIIGPVKDDVIFLYCNQEKQYLEITCLKPFENKILITICSSINNKIKDQLVLKYIPKIKLNDSKLYLDSDTNKIELKNEIEISKGTELVNIKEQIIDIKLVKENEDYIKSLMKKKSEEIIKEELRIKEIDFNHTFINFNKEYYLSLFNPSINKILYDLGDHISYSYFHDGEKKEDEITYYFYDLLSDNLIEIFKMDLFEIDFIINDKKYHYIYSL